MGDNAIRDSLISERSQTVSRERVIAAIYETVIRPSLYDAFMKAWHAHIQTLVDDTDADRPVADVPGALAADPELQSHFSRAYEMLEQIGRKGPQIDLAERVARTSSFAILAKLDGTVTATSASARDMLAGQRRLEPLIQRLTAQSAGLLGDLMASGGGKPNDESTLVLSTDTLPRHLIARLAQDGQTQGRPCLRVVIEALDYQWSDRAAEMLVTSFGLSRAEVEIVRNLMAGHNLREIAARSDRSEHTVRNQAKAVLAKTGAPGQVDLIRLVAFLINQDDQDHQTHTTVDTVPHEMLKMSSGLRMQLFRAGAADGRPVIFLHGMLDGMAPIKFLQDRLAARGLQVIAPVRPGFGRSDPVRAVGDTLDVFCSHVQEMVARLGLQNPVILGQKTGTVYGQILACRMRGRIAGLVAVSGGVPVLRMRQLSHMGPRQRAVAYTARFAPALLPAILRAGIAQIDSQDIDGFITALYRPGTREHDVIEALHLGEKFQPEYRFSVEQGTSGFLADSLFVVKDWSAEIADPSAPATYISGEHDVVVNPREITKVLGVRPEFDVRIIPDACQMVLYEQPDLVLDAVEERMMAAAPG